MHEAKSQGQMDLEQRTETGEPRAQGRRNSAVYVPVPATLTFCGLAPPSSVTASVAVRFPLADGVNVTGIKQLAPAATLVPQHQLAKSAAFVPVKEIPVMLTATLPLLLNVILLGRLLVPTG